MVMQTFLRHSIFTLLAITILCPAIFSQDLEPRAYVRIPINANVLVTGASLSTGGVLTDPTSPLKDLKATVKTITVGYVRSFSLGGLTAQALAVVPFCFLNGSASINGQTQTGSRTGFADMRLRMSVLLLGGKAMTLREMMKNNRPRTILGTSLTVQAPTGQYYDDKIINLGTSRWAFKPELALSQPINKRWLVDAYAGVWFFSRNNSFFPGSSIKSQAPIGAFQAHASYTIKPNMWVAVNGTYYMGGHTSINDVAKDDRISNTRIGATVVLPTGKKSGLKLAFSKGAVVLAGTDFTTYSIGWNYTWF